jgi:hypothetical protein
MHTHLLLRATIELVNLDIDKITIIASISMEMYSATKRLTPLLAFFLGINVEKYWHLCQGRGKGSITENPKI